MKKLACILFFMGFMGAVYSFQAEPERILSFDSAVTVNKDSTLSVTETITVNCIGDQIRHGIYREFPTRYKDRSGNAYNVDFVVTSVSRDGKPDSYHLQRSFNGTRVYIGQKDVLLAPGRYTYILRYTTNRQLGFFKDFDELYWNVTGNQWVFPIDNASVTITLPRDAGDRLRAYGGYTGPKGALQKNFSVSVDGPKSITFVTTKGLAAREGLTVFLDWPKGFVTEPTPRMKAEYFIRDNAGQLVGGAGLFLVLIYYLVVWNNVGRDPAKGTIIPLYTPSDNLSPAAMRFISRMDFDNKVLSAAIIDMAVKGYLTIEELGGTYTLMKREHADFSMLAEEEKTLASVLLGPEGSLTLVNTHHEIVSAAIRNLRMQLQKKYERTFFFTNHEYFIPGVVLSTVAIMISALLQAAERFPIALFMSFWLSMWTFGVVALLTQAVNAWKSFILAKKISAAGSAIFLTLFSIPFVFGELVGLGVLIFATSVSMVPILLVLVSINFLFFHLLKAPTLLGRSIMDKIEGFRMYLSVAEKERLNVLNPPDKTPELFEKYLPFALALDVEQAWAEQFSGVLEKAARTSDGYSPVWFHGSSWNTFSAGSFASSLGSAISSAGLAPGSSGGGGGSSGGGGGGGGGGGW